MALSAKHAEIKNRTIGSSDVGALFDESKFHQRHDVYMRLAGIRPAVADEELDPDDPRSLGSEFEGVIRQRYIARLAQEFNITPAQIRWTVPGDPIMHPEIEYMSSTPDVMIAEDIDTMMPLRCGEMKLCFYADRSEWGEEFTDQVPADYLLQCHHHMLITGASVCDLFAWFGRTDFRLYHVTKDPELEFMIEQECERFMSLHVEPKVPPPLTYGHRSTSNALRLMYPGTNGEEIELPPKLASIHDALQMFSQKIARLERARDALKEEILDHMGEAAVAYIDGRDGAYVRSVVKRAGYEVKPTSYVAMRYVAKKNRQE
jgi:predicted phage-related endonuclease